MAALFSVDGISYRVRVPEGGLTRGFEVRDAEEIRYFLSGDILRKVMGTYYSYELELDCTQTAPEEYDRLYQVLSAPQASHTVTFPYGQTTLTFQAYITDGEDVFRRRLAGKNQWGRLRIRFYAMAPSRRPA